MTYHFAKNALKSALVICYCILTLLLATYGTSSSAHAATVRAYTSGSALAGGNPLSIARYNGKGYSFLYDSAWKARPDRNNGVSISHNGTRLDVLVQHTTTPIGVLQFEFGTQSSVNCRRAGRVPRTVTIDYVTWKLARYICVSPVQGHSSDEIITLDPKDAIGGTYYSMAVVAKYRALDKHAFKSIASFRFE